MNKFYLFIGLILFSFNVFAQQQHPENCPFGGVVDCTGQCGLFVDENGDGFCDNAVLSTSKKDIKTENITQKKQTESSNKTVKNTKQNDNVAEKHQGVVSNDNNSKNNINNTKINDSESITTPNKTSFEQNKEPIRDGKEPIHEYETSIHNSKTNVYKPNTPYHFWQVLISTIILYCCSAVLVKTKTIKKYTHRKIWNVVLGITCLISCLTGVYVVFAKMYGFSMNYITLMKFHVDFGVSMTVIAVIHILWHLNYWKNLFKSAGKKA